jgi:hypothetical protein
VFAIGYSIFYDRAFIRAGDQYVPLVNSGASNAATPEGLTDKGWEVLNWRRRDRVLFSDAEIREIAREYEQHNAENRMSFKSRYKPFEPGEFERWILGGMKRACTVEEYCSFGNAFFVAVPPASGNIGDLWPRRPFTTTEEMLAILGEIGKLSEIRVSLENSRKLFLPTRARAGSRGRTSVLNTLRSQRAQPSQPKPKRLGLNKGNNGVDR